MLKSNVHCNCYKYNTSKSLKTYSNWNAASCAPAKTRVSWNRNKYNLVSFSEHTKATT